MLCIYITVRYMISYSSTDNFAVISVTFDDIVLLIISNKWLLVSLSSCSRALLWLCFLLSTVSEAFNDFFTL